MGNSHIGTRQSAEVDQTLLGIVIDSGETSCLTSGHLFPSSAGIATIDQIRLGDFNRLAIVWSIVGQQAGKQFLIKYATVTISQTCV